MEGPQSQSVEIALIQIAFGCDSLSQGASGKGDGCTTGNEKERERERKWHDIVKKLPFKEKVSPQVLIGVGREKEMVIFNSAIFEL